MKILEVLTKRRMTGNLGERAAVRYLRLHGYRIRRRNFVAGDAEIDVIAESRSVLAFVEVKTRTLGHITPKEPRPASAVTPEKQRKIIKASLSYPGFYSAKKRIRYDVIEVYLKDSDRPKIDTIKHLESAFDKNSAYPHSKRG